MKKFLGIFVLGLLLSGNAFAEKNIKNKIPILMCGGHAMFYPKYPTTYEEFLNDGNLYYAIAKKKIAMGWDWKEGRFTQTIPITSNTTETIVAISEDFWDTKSKKPKFFLELNKYSMKMIVGMGVLDKNLFTKDKIKVQKTRVANCSTIDVKKLFKLKPRID